MDPSSPNRRCPVPALPWSILMARNPQASTLASVLGALILMAFLAPDMAQKVFLALFSAWIIARFLVAFMGSERS